MNTQLSQSLTALEDWANTLDKLPVLSLGSLLTPENASSTDHIRCMLVDPINGFINHGALADPKIRRIIEPIRGLAQKAIQLSIPTLAFADAHSPEAQEFKSFPPHCLEGSEESLLVEELQDLDITVLPKNSTNGFFAPGFHAVLDKTTVPSVWIAAGDCTDICLMQFTLTLLGWYRQQDMPCRIIVPVNAVGTYDAPGHEEKLHHLMALKFMQDAGIELVKECII